MCDHKNLINKTTRIEREKLCDDALSYSTLGASKPSDDTMKLVEEYVLGNLEVAEALEKVIDKYRTMS